MRIQHNIAALNSYRQLSGNNSALSKNLEKLSSGYRINRAGDDAAGLAISEKMRAQIKGLEAAQKNANDGISLVQTAEGALTEVHSMLNRMVYLATQSANGTYDNEVDRANLDKEFQTLKTEIDRIAQATNFNGINLLDGESGNGGLTKLPVEYNTTSTTAGVTLGKVQDGAGSNGTFTIEINNKFSYGDVLTIKGTLSGTTGIGAAGADNIALTMAQTGADLTFDGDTAEAQAESIANALTGKIGGYYDVKADGNKVVITAKTEGTEVNGTKVGTIDSATVTTQASPGITAATGTAAADGTAGNKYIGALEVLGGKTAGQSGNIAEGDILTFNFTDANGNDLSAKIVATKEMANERAEVATKAIVDALNEATFEDNKNTTGIDESQIKVSDLFTLTANKEETVAGGKVANGTIRVEAKNAAIVAGGNSATSVVIDRNGSKTTVEDTITDGQAAAAAGGTPAAQVWTHTAKPTNNFTAGDKVKVEGTLADGRTFEVTLEAGKDFEIDKNTTANTAIDNTMTNLANALKKADVTVELKKDGKDAGTMTGEDLFGTKGEFTATSTGGVLSITSARKGTSAAHNASNITGVTVEALDNAKVNLGKDLATAQGAAKSSITFDDKLTYGAAVKVGDKTYEIVADARDTVNRNNTAVVVKDPTDAKAVAKALSEAINKNETDYTADYADGTVTVSSNKIGSAQKALSVATPYGDKVTTASFAFDPKVVKNNSQLTFNGQKYEFVKKGENVKNDGAIAVEVADFSKATSKELGEAFLDVLNNGTGTIAEDGTITLRSNEVDGKIADPVIKFANNLKLQIGDTAAEYNQLTVELSDMHVAAMGLTDTNIASLDDAAAAVDKIKSAINYVSDVRGGLGAIQNRLDHTINNLGVQTENITAAESRIRDTDMAEEMMAYTKNNILVQAAQAMLAQANQVPQGVLQLLQ